MEIPGRDGPLPLGWHRVTWVWCGAVHYVVTENIASAALMHAVLVKQAEVQEVSDVSMQSWSDYPIGEREKEETGT